MVLSKDKFPNPTNYSQATLNLDRRGKELREEEKVWKGVAASESRIELMKVMIKQGIAFADLEEFGLEFQNKIKSKKLKEKLNDRNIQNQVTQPVMKMKLADEQNLRREMVKVKIKLRRELEKDLGGKSEKYKRAMSHLAKSARETKHTLQEKYKKKIKHLNDKYKDDRDKELETVPEGLEEYSELSVFSKDKYAKLEKRSYEVKTIGDVTLSEEETEILRLHNKFFVIGNLQQGDLDSEQEASLAKIRMEINKEKENEEFTPLERKEMEEIEAEERMVYNPKDDIFDGRKRRVTDLRECARVTLPKPLSDDEESKLEVRKRAQKEVFEKYRKENTTKKGEQKSNLTRKELLGLKSLQKRIEKEEIIVMKTDKSSKFVVTTPEEYKNMGKEHTEKDEEVDMKVVKEMEKKINQHTIAWSLMWNSGENHNHGDRIVKSKVTRSGNQANLSLLYKDHKTGNKTRPVASGNESFNLGLSNGVSEVMESVSKSMKNPYSVISSEDMLARVRKYNEVIERKKEEWLIMKGLRLACNECNILEQQCNQHIKEDKFHELIKEENWDKIKDAIENSFENQCCGETAYKVMKTDCKSCGKGITKEKMTMCLVGSDVIALYPSLSARNTGRIIKERIEKSNIKFEGFDDKKGRVYVVLNKDLAGNLEELKGLLPWRVTNKGTTPTMASVGPKWNPDEQWEFPKKELTGLERRKVFAKVTEIAVVTLFENFSYKFGGKNFRQNSGGPIGVRATGAASQLVVEDWAENYFEILEKADIWVALEGGYVDDGRQITNQLEKGMRFDKESKSFLYSTEGYEEDLIMEQKGESPDEFMAVELLYAVSLQ